MMILLVGSYSSRGGVNVLYLDGRAARPELLPDFFFGLLLIN